MLDSTSPASAFADLLTQADEGPPTHDGTARWMYEHPEVAAECRQHFENGVRPPKLHKVLKAHYGYPWSLPSFRQYLRDHWR